MGGLNNRLKVASMKFLYLQITTISIVYDPCFQHFATQDEVLGDKRFGKFIVIITKS